LWQPSPKNIRAQNRLQPNRRAGGRHGDARRPSALFRAGASINVRSRPFLSIPLPPPDPQDLLLPGI
ncbi:hypothetical protein, partial [uncultured Roseovarius sp.]|uniref:hypothetical protein n=1 Tax=uncultured Roseovarius sp. TaxID=293344 RepID=UPI00261776A7